jgi:hypothetical protein
MKYTLRREREQAQVKHKVQILPEIAPGRTRLIFYLTFLVIFLIFFSNTSVHNSGLPGPAPVPFPIPSSTMPP